MRLSVGTRTAARPPPDTMRRSKSQGFARPGAPLRALDFSPFAWSRAAIRPAGPPGGWTCAAPSPAGARGSLGRAKGALLSLRVALRAPAVRTRGLRARGSRAQHTRAAVGGGGAPCRQNGRRAQNDSSRQRQTLSRPGAAARASRRAQPPPRPAFQGGERRDTAHHLTGLPFCRLSSIWSAIA